MKMFLSNKHWKGNSDIQFTENDEILLENKDVVNVLNNYFLIITSLHSLSDLNGRMNLAVKW